MKRIIDCKVYIKDLKYGLGNPRKITEQKLNDLKDSINSFGVWRDIGIDEANNVVFGNQLSIALKEIGIEIPVNAKRFIGYSEKELKAINIKDNEHQGDWDYDLLSEWLEGLKDFDFEKIGHYDKNFIPEVQENQSRLDLIKKIKCPNCGMEFDKNYD